MATILVAGSVVTAVTLGVRATMGLFSDDVSTSLAVGIDTFGLTLAGQNLIWGLAQPFAGAIADRFGAVRVLLAGAFTYTAGLLVMASATGPAGLYLGAGVIVGLGMSAASFAVVLSAMSKLIEPERRSMALGLATAFGSFGHFLLVPMAGAMIAAFGWRTAIAVLAMVIASTVLTMRPLRTGSRVVADPGDAAGDHEPLRSVVAAAARHRDYLLINSTFFVCGFHVTFIAVHLPKSLTDLGLTTSVAAWSLAFIGLFNIGGAFTAGLLGSRLDKSRMLTVIYGTRAVAFVGFMVMPAVPAVALGFGALLGIVWLASVPLTSGIVLGQFGARNAGTLFGFVFLSHQLGAFAGAYGGGLVREITGSYDLWWGTCAVLGIIAALVHFQISERPAPDSKPRSSPALGVASAST